MNKFLKNMSWLKVCNFLLQIFFIRLTKCSEKRVDSIDIESYDYVQGNGTSSRARGTLQKYQWWSIVYFILPFTGWGYKYITLTKKPKFLKITSPKKL